MSTSSPDLIELQGLRLVALIGALPEERTRPQPLEIDLYLGADLSTAGASDELADTIDYGAVCATVAAVVEDGWVRLLERLAAKVVEAIFHWDERITQVTVSIRKVRPPVPHDLDTSGVRISRVRVV